MSNNRDITTREEIQDMYSFIDKESSPAMVSKRKKNSILNIVFNVVIALLLVLILLFFTQIRILQNQGESSNINGYKIYSVQSNNMEPLLMENTLIIAKLYENQSINVSDIIICYNVNRDRVIKKVDGYTFDQTGLYVSDYNTEEGVEEIVLYKDVEAVYKKVL